MIKTIEGQFRQGDVLVNLRRADIPGDAKPVAREKGKIVLAHGEATGHAHAIAAPNAALLFSGAERFLRVQRVGAWLRHEEHMKIYFPPADYDVIRQREYTPEAIRTVAD